MMHPIALRALRKVWMHSPESFRHSSLGQLYGRFLNALVRGQATRFQYFGTFFLRNRAELELMCRLVDRYAFGREVNIAVLACSKGAEVYSISWALRSARPDLKLTIHAVDISKEILEFAQKGVYSLSDPDSSRTGSEGGDVEKSDLAWNTWRDQNVSIFGRLTREEMAALFEVNGDFAKIRPPLREGIRWICADANDPELPKALEYPSIVVANRFLCHMKPQAAEKCLRNIARLVGLGGYLFVSGIDLDVRTRVAREMDWKPVHVDRAQSYDRCPPRAKGVAALLECWLKEL